MNKTVKRILLTFSVLGLLFVASEVEASDPNGEIFCMAKNIYFEAGNQPVAGKIAVSPPESVQFDCLQPSANPFPILAINSSSGLSSAT